MLFIDNLIPGYYVSDQSKKKHSSSFPDMTTSEISFALSFFLWILADGAYKRSYFLKSDGANKTQFELGNKISLNFEIDYLDHYHEKANLMTINLNELGFLIF